MEQAIQELPLFPLNTVLFPKMMLPLHIFEERYKEMINACLDRDSHFGVVLIGEGQETGEPAIPHNVGTTARIAQVTRLDDGRLNLIATGERRFYLDEVTQWRPYLKGRVRLVEQEEVGEPAPSAEAIEALHTMLETYLRALLGLRSGWVREVSSPTDPVILSFYIATVIRNDNELLQRVLESRTAVERLELVTPLLTEASQQTRRKLEERLADQEGRLN